MIGFSKAKFKGYTPGFEGQQMAIYLESKYTNSIISHVYFEIKKFGKCHANLRLRLLAPENNELGQDLIIDNLIINTKKSGSKIKIDVSKYGIRMPDNGVYVAIDWLPVDCDNLGYSYRKEGKKKKITKYKMISPKVVMNEDGANGLTWFGHLNKGWISHQVYISFNPSIGLGLLVNE